MMIVIIVVQGNTYVLALRMCMFAERPYIVCLPVISYEVISHDLFSNLIQLIKFNLFHNNTVLKRIYIINY